MRRTKPTPIDLAEYVVHTIDCESRYFYMKDGKVVEDSFGECNCGLNELLESLGLPIKYGLSS